MGAPLTPHRGTCDGGGAPLTQFDDVNLAVRSKCVRALRLLGCHGAQERGLGWSAPGFLICGLTVFVGPIW